MARVPWPARRVRGPSLRSEEEGALYGRREVLLALGVLAILTGSSSGAAALVDDFETDFWLPYTDFLLGDKASAGYSSTYVRSGMRSYHVDVSGYSILDFGSAYGYAVYATRGAAVTELRVSLLYDHLQDASVSPWDAYASGVALDLLDKDYRSLDRVRYITSFQASRKLSLCGPTKADVVLAPPSGLGVWTDLARNPAVDFPAAHWTNAKFVRIAIGFLCTAGLRAPPTRCTSTTSCSTPVRATRTGTDSATWTRRRECMRCRSPPAPCPPRFRPPGRPQSTSMRRPLKALSNGPGSRWRSTIPGRTISRSKSACPIDPDLPPSCCGIPASTRAGPRSSNPRAEPPSEGPSTSAAKLGSPIRSSTST